MAKGGPRASDHWPVWGLFVAPLRRRRLHRRSPSVQLRGTPFIDSEEKKRHDSSMYEPDGDSRAVLMTLTLGLALHRRRSRRRLGLRRGPRAGLLGEDAGMGGLRGHGGHGAPITDRHRPGRRRSSPDGASGPSSTRRPSSLINNGHTIEEEYQPGSSLIVDGVRYDLAQFHFHALVRAHRARSARSHGAARGLRGPGLRQEGRDRNALHDRKEERVPLRVARRAACRKRVATRSTRLHGSSTSRTP